MAPARALLLFAHGARDPRWAEPFEAIAGLIRAADPHCTVALAFLELMRPGLREAADALVAGGARRIDIVPLFLGTGGHLRKDLPPLVDEVRAAHAAVTISLHAAIGEHPEVAAAMARAALAMASSVNNPPLPPQAAS